MNLSISEFGKNIWAWLFWGLGFYLVLELGPFLIAGWVFKKTANELAGPYLAFAAPWAIMAPLIWWLRKWEETGVSPKRVAHGWGLSMALFGVAVAVAVFYSGVALRLVDRKDAIVSFIVGVLLSVPIFYYTLYRLTLPRISARASGKPCIPSISPPK
jgi:hypothetical protein